MGQRSLFASSAFAAVQVLWTTCVLFAVYRITAQHAGVGLLGLWSGAVAIAAFAALADCGLTDLMVRQIAEARGRHDRARVLGLYRSVCTFSGVLVAAAALALTPIIVVVMSPVAPESIRPFLWWVVAAASFTVWLNTVNVGLFGVLEAFGRYDLKFWAGFASGIGTLASALLVVPRAPALGVAVTFVVGATINAAFALIANAFVLRRFAHTDAGYAGAEKISRSEQWAMIKMGVQVRLAGIFLLGLEPVTRILLTRFAGLEAVGLYELAYRAIFQLRSLIVAALQVLVPGLAAIRLQNPQRAVALLSQATYQAVVVGLPAFALAICVVPLLSLAMLGRLDWQLVQFALLLAAAWAVNMVAAPGYFANLAEGKVKNNWLAHLAMCVVNIALGLVLGAAFGAAGVVVATALAVTAGSCVTLLSRRSEPLRARFSLTASDWIVLFAGVACVVSVLLLWKTTHADAVVVSIACALLGCYGIALALRVFLSLSKHSGLRQFAAT